jgi:O-antigen ligase
MERVTLWKMALMDAKCHPIKGFGMDSFRKITSSKNFQYMMGGDRSPSLWDNPHNLYISLGYEFGFLVFIILGGYIRQLIISFKKSSKNSNVIALAGFIMVFFVISIGSFPAFLCRTMVFIIPCFALYEVSCA